MKIVLLRHGRPDISENRKLRASELQQWIKSYNSASIVSENVPSKNVIEIANTCNVVVCSDLPRSIESAKMLGLNEINIIESVFKEMGLPFGRFPLFKMRPTIWAALFRLLWFFGYSSNSESLTEGKIRAKVGANLLKEAAIKGGPVLFVGHGFINRFIAKELLSSGWKGPKYPGKKYWEFGVYERTI
jgi:broad specificity phosphatase PhoE